MTPEQLRTRSFLYVHGDCSDGLASSMICRDVMDHVSITFLTHTQDEYRQLPAQEGSMFVDMAPPDERVQEFVEVDTYVLDHHKGAENLVKLFPNHVFADEKKDPGVSGALLAFREVWLKLATIEGRGHSNQLVRKKVEEFATLVGIRDTWQSQHPDFDRAQSIHSALMFYPLNHWLGHPPWVTEEEEKTGRLVRVRHVEDVKRAAHSAWLFTELEQVGDDRGRAIRVAVIQDRAGTLRLTSDVAELLRQQGVDVTIGFWYEKTKGGSPKLAYSVRSNDRFDAGGFARYNGGNGHTQAAGFSTAAGDCPFMMARRLVFGWLELVSANWRIRHGS